jgi:hypothetical protein
VLAVLAVLEVVVAVALQAAAVNRRATVHSAPLRTSSAPPYKFLKNFSSTHCTNFGADHYLFDHSQTGKRRRKHLG